MAACNHKVTTTSDNSISENQAGKRSPLNANYTEWEDNHRTPSLAKDYSTHSELQTQMQGKLPMMQLSVPTPHPCSIHMPYMWQRQVEAWQNILLTVHPASVCFSQPSQACQLGQPPANVPMVHCKTSHLGCSKVLNDVDGAGKAR